MVYKLIQFLKKNDIKVDLYVPVLFNQPVLHYAIDSGHKEMVEVLIQEAPLVDINGKSNALDLPLLLAYTVAFGTTAIAEVLLDAGADPNWIYDRNEPLIQGNALMFAEAHNRKDIANYLINHPLIHNWNASDYRHDQTALMRIAFSRYPGWSNVLSTLLQKGAAITPLDADSRDVLMHLLTRYNIYLSNA